MPVGRAPDEVDYIRGRSKELLVLHGWCGGETSSACHIVPMSPYSLRHQFDDRCK